MCVRGGKGRARWPPRADDGRRTGARRQQPLGPPPSRISGPEPRPPSTGPRRDPPPALDAPAFETRLDQLDSTTFTAPSPARSSAPCRQTTHLPQAPRRPSRTARASSCVSRRSQAVSQQPTPTDARQPAFVPLSFELSSPFTLKPSSPAPLTMFGDDAIKLIVDARRSTGASPCPFSSHAGQT